MAATLNRRRALGRLATGGLGVAASGLWVNALSALAREQGPHAHAAAAQAVTGGKWTPKILNPHQLATVSTLSELIIPETETPGAKAALVDRFIDEILSKAEPADRQRFQQGLSWLDSRSRTLFGKDFVSATVEQQTELLSKLAPPASREASTGVNFFTAIKSMTITGYYTTEIGLHQELGDDGVLAQATFEGCTHPEHQM